MLTNLAHGHNTTEPWQRVNDPFTPEAPIQRRDFLNFRWRELSLFARPRYERPELSRINEEDLTDTLPETVSTVATLGQEPQATWNLGIGEKLFAQLYDAVDMIKVDKSFSTLESRGLAVGQLTRCHHKSRCSAFPKMGQEMEDPHGICVASR